MEMGGTSALPERRLPLFALRLCVKTKCNRLKIINLTPPNSRFPVFCFDLAAQMCILNSMSKVHEEGCPPTQKKCSLEEIFFYHSTLLLDASFTDHGKEFAIDQHCLFLRFRRELFPSTCDRQMKGVVKLPIHFSSTAEQSSAEIIFSTLWIFSHI